MTVNISAQTTVLTIGAEDWSAWIESISIGYGEYDTESGLMPCTGTINLQFPANYAGIPSNPEYRFNPTQWRRGQAVTIAVGGNALPCSGSSLKILTPPQRPDKDISGIARLSISVGCALAYEYFPPEPNDDFSGVTAGTPRSRGAIINSILSTLGITSSVSIPELPIDYPLPKIEGNWLEFCGQLAYSAGYYLRCNTAGAVIAERVMNNGASGITYTIGVDESDWQPIGNVAEQAIEKLIISGVKRSLDAFNTTDSSIEYQPLGVLFPDAYPTATGTIPSKRRNVTRIRSANTSQVIETIEEPLGVLFPAEYPTATGTIPSKRTTTTTFFSDGNIFKTIELIEEPLGILFSSEYPTATGTIPSKRTTKEWTKIGNQKYREVFLEEQPLGVLFPDVYPTATGLIPSKQTTTDGESSPPTEQPVSDFNLLEEQITSTVYASQPSPSIGRERQRTIALPFADNVAQLSTFGQLFNQILTGRAFGWRFATRLSTALLPMQSVSVIDGTQGYKFRTDAIQWAISLTEAYLVFNGIEVGVFDVATPDEITFPVAFPLAPVSAMLISADYSQRFVFTFGVSLISTDYADSATNAIFARLFSADYSTRNNSIFARLISRDYGQVAVEDLNSKIIAYWNFDAITNLEWSSGNFADFIANELNPTDVSYALSPELFTTISLGTGLINDALIPLSRLFIEPSFNGDPSIADPAVNGFDFAGFALWLGSTISFPDDWIGTTDFTICFAANMEIRGEIFENAGTSNLRINIYNDSNLLGQEFIASSNDINGRWDLIIVEVDRIALTISLSINGNTATSFAYTESGALTAFEIKSNTFNTNDSVYFGAVDEAFIYTSPLSASNIATIYNGGAGNTYPF
jgi:hypothetical protein